MCTGDDRGQAHGHAHRGADRCIQWPAARQTLWPSAFAVLDGLRKRARATDDILIVNDDAAENDLLADILAPLLGSGRVVVARAVDEAIAMIDAALDGRAIPRLALIDVHLPRANGDVLLEHLAARPAAAAMTTVMLTGCATPTLQARCLALGARQVVTKPFTFDGWLRLFERLVPPRASG